MNLLDPIGTPEVAYKKESLSEGNKNISKRDRDKGKEEWEEGGDLFDLSLNVVIEKYSSFTCNPEVVHNKRNSCVNSG